ncbi:hypothetical protein N3K66_007332 [Trichothecium roseum]|uniref:Uncharacterized protein n=1 Tax=Trichothecium roseum TaxID=47278 RepID=A0ACC0UTP3_9HYPO|nr:hypothetical protein N3K66_007332 [Trichothecium roseum]
MYHVSPRGQAQAAAGDAIIPIVDEGKIDLIDKRLDSVGRLINTFLSSEAAQSPQSAQQDAPPPTPAPTPTSTLATQTSRTPHITDDEGTTSSVPELNQASCRKILRGSQHAPRGSGADTGNNEEDSEENLVEGPSALSAHSNFAIDLVDRLAAFDTRELLDRLRRITDAIKAQRQVPDLLLPHPTPPVTAADFVKNRMPPIETAVAVLRAAQERTDASFVFIHELLAPQGLSDLCLKIYFSDDYTDVELIILNAALFCMYDLPLGRSYKIKG